MAQTNVQRLIDQNSGPSGPTYPPATDFASMKFEDFDRILTSATTPTTAIENVSAAWKQLALSLRSAIMGRPLAFNGSADPFANGFPADSQSVLSKFDKTNDGSFDSLLGSLAGWQGAAADAFLSKALEVRSFALGLAQRFYASDNGAMYAGGAWNGCEFNYTVDTMAKALAPTQDIYRQLKPWYEVTVVQNLWDFLAGKQGWNGMNLQVQGTFTLNSIKGGTSTITIKPAYGQQTLTTGQPTGYQVPTGFTFVYRSQADFRSTTGDTFLNGVSYMVSGAVSGSTTTGPTNVTFAPDANGGGPFAYPGGTYAIADLRGVGGGQRILYTVLAGQHHANLSSLLTITAREYVWGAAQMPDTPTPPKDVSTGGSTSSSSNTNTANSLPPGPTNPTLPKYSTPHNTPLSGPSTGATGHPLSNPSGHPAGLSGANTNIGKSGTGGGTAGYTPIPSSPYHPGTLSPESTHLGDVGTGTSAFDSGKLASFTPGAGAALGGGILEPSGLSGTGLGGPATGGLDAGAGGASGLGGPGGGFGPAAAGGAGAGAGAGAAGMAGRGGMPMAPMGAGAGAGGGKDAKERQRKAFLTEDDDIWGADGGEAPAVL